MIPCLPFIGSEDDDYETEDEYPCKRKRSRGGAKYRKKKPGERTGGGEGSHGNNADVPTHSAFPIEDHSSDGNTPTSQLGETGPDGGK